MIRKSLKSTLILAFLLFLSMGAIAEEVASAPPESSAESLVESPVESSEKIEGNETLYVEFVWLHDKKLCEALLMVPEHKVPMMIVRILDEDEQLLALVAAQTSFQTWSPEATETEDGGSGEDDGSDENGESGEDEGSENGESGENRDGENDGNGGDELILECSGTQILWGKAGFENEVPQLLLIQGNHGVVDLGGTMAPCLVQPVGGNTEAAVLGKYIVPETEATDQKDEKNDDK